jgi:transcriptional regulator with XRE-family HTH domain
VVVYADGVNSYFMATIQVRLGKTIRRLRKDMGVGQERFANDIVGIHRTTISKIERGAYDISVSTLERIAVGLRISASQLLAQAEEEGRRKKPA